MSQHTSPARPVLLVVDDEPEIRALLSEYFDEQGFDVRAVPDAATARSCVAACLPIIALLDVRMPGESGLSLARWLRAAHPQVGLLILAHADDSIDRVVGLELGADDFVPKPFHLRELLARIRAVMRRMEVGEAHRAAPATVARPTVPLGNLKLDLNARRLVAADGSDVPISSGEFDMLSLFVRHPNVPLNRDQIMEQAHYRGCDPFDRSIDLRVMRLRRKIEVDPERPKIIKTVRNFGYMFMPPERMSA